MFYYKEEERKQGRIIGGIATVVYAVLVLLLLLLVKFGIDSVEEEGEGILINFGNTDAAAPGGDMAANDFVADAAQASQAATAGEEEVLTQDVEEAPVVQQQQRPQANPSAQPQPVNRPTETPAEAPREVDRRALFPGRTAGSTATSDGTATGTGNQGDPAGSPDGAHDGTGTGTSGNSANLRGRSLLGSLPKPDYNAREQGRVIVEIVVDQQGKVTSAAFRSVGSTTQNSTLVNAAINAARKARFNVDENASLSQTGTITYNFRMQ